VLAFARRSGIRWFAAVGPDLPRGGHCASAVTAACSRHRQGRGLGRPVDRGCERRWWTARRICRSGRSSHGLAPQGNVTDAEFFVQGRVPLARPDPVRSTRAQPDHSLVS